MHRVVMILRVRRIDGDERNSPPVLTLRQAGGLRGFGFRQRLTVDAGAGG
jgi:hypothetical protein